MKQSFHVVLTLAIGGLGLSLAAPSASAAHIEESVTCRLEPIATGTPQEAVAPPGIGIQARDIAEPLGLCLSLDENPPQYSLTIRTNFQYESDSIWVDVDETSVLCISPPSTAGQALATCPNQAVYPSDSPVAGPRHRAKFVFATPNGSATYYSKPWASDLLCRIVPGFSATVGDDDVAEASGSCHTGDIGREYTLSLTVTPQFLEPSTSTWIDIDSVICLSPAIAGQAVVETCPYVREAGPVGSARRVEVVLEADETVLVKYFPSVSP